MNSAVKERQMATASTQPNSLKLAVLGTGKMGGILAEAFVKQGLVSEKDIFATVHHSDLGNKNSLRLPISLGTDNLAATREANVILICVKPDRRSVR